MFNSKFLWFVVTILFVRFDGSQQQNFSLAPVNKDNLCELTGYHFRVTVVIDQPLVFYKPNYQDLEGNERFQGYCIDVLVELAKKCGFNYTITLNKDNAYGAQRPDGTWSGMIGDLINEPYQADLAATALTVTRERTTVIEFTAPLLYQGIGILLQKPRREEPSIIAFLDPFTGRVWGFIIVALIVLSLLFWLISRFSPFECHGIEDEPDPLGFGNCFWYMLASLLSQASDLQPQAASTRIISAVWWFFTFVLMSTYTANLAAFLTVQRLASPINSFDDLAKQSRISYGCIRDTSTLAFFKNAIFDPYQSMYEHMRNAIPSVLVANTSDGVARAKAGGYAFFGSAATLAYYASGNCDLTMIDAVVNTKGSSFATRKDPKSLYYKSEIGQAILQLDDETVLSAYYDRWFKANGQTCDEETSANRMDIKNLQGIFIMLVVGIVISLLTLFCERCLLNNPKVRAWKKNAKQRFQNLKLSRFPMTVLAIPRNSLALNNGGANGCTRLACRRCTVIPTIPVQLGNSIAMNCCADHCTEKT